MATSIKLFRGAFGHVSVLNVASDLVTHAHAEAHIIVWIDGDRRRDDGRRRDGAARAEMAVGVNSLRAAQPRPSRDGQRRPLPRLLHRSRMGLPPPRRSPRTSRCSQRRRSRSMPGCIAAAVTLVRAARRRRSGRRARALRDRAADRQPDSTPPRRRARAALAHRRHRSSISAFARRSS